MKHLVNLSHFHYHLTWQDSSMPPSTFSLAHCTILMGSEIKTSRAPTGQAHTTAWQQKQIPE